MVTVEQDLPAITFARNQTLLRLSVSWGGGSAPTNYRVQVEVHWEEDYGSDTFARVAVLQPAYNADNEIWLDLQSILTGEWHKAHQAGVLLPPAGGTDPVRADNLRRYFVRYREGSGSPVDYDDWATLETSLVMWGGVDNRTWAGANYLLDIAENNSILTWWKDGKTVSPQQPEWLAWFNWTGVAKYAYLTLSRWTDEFELLDDEDIFTGHTVLLEPYETILFPVSPLALGLTSDIRKYKVQVMDGQDDWALTGDSISQPRSYYVDDLFYRSLRFVHYLNGFGVPCTFRHAGEESNSMEVSRSSSGSPLAPGYGPNDGTQLQWGFAFERSRAYRSGYVRKEDAEVLAEMLIYNQLFEVYPEAEYVRLHLVGDKFKMYDSREFLYSVEFEAVPALSPGNYTRGLSPVDPPDWNALAVLPESEYFYLLADESGFYEKADGSGVYKLV